MPEHPSSYIQLRISGAPTAGVSEVQTLTIGGTPTGGTFTIKKDGVTTGAIAWSATNATLLANMNAAMDAKFGTGSIVATAGTVVAGIGTVILTFGGKLAMLAVSTMTIGTNSLTGTTPTLAIAETTPGVTATARDALRGALIQSDNGNVYRNSATVENAPVWVTI